MTTVHTVTVYVVTEGSYSDYRIVAIFSSREKAEAFLARPKIGEHYNDFNEIEEYQLDNDGTDERARGLKFYSVHMELTGDKARVEETEPYRASYPKGWIGRPLNNCAPPWFAVDLWARDRKHAIKSANDRRIRMLAEEKRP